MSSAALPVHSLLGSKQVQFGFQLLVTLKVEFYLRSRWKDPVPTREHHAPKLWMVKSHVIGRLTRPWVTGAFAGVLGALTICSSMDCQGGREREKSRSVYEWVHLCVCSWASQVVLEVKNPSTNIGDARDTGSISGSGRSPVGGMDGNTLQYSCLENPTDRGAWWATVHGAAKNQTRWKLLSPAHTSSEGDDALLICIWKARHKEGEWLGTWMGWI